MATQLLPAGGIALLGAPDSDIGSRDARPTPIQAMQVDMAQELVDELLESMRSGKPPQIFFGRTPQLRYGDKTHALQACSESNRHELYHASGAGGDDDDLEFTSLVNHRLIVQKAEAAAAGVDTALEQLKNSMAAISESKQANKTIVGTAGTPVHTPGHRRVTSKGFVPAHLAASSGSPRLNVPNSPMAKRPAPTSQPNGTRDVILAALRVPLVHLLAVQPSKEAYLADTCRTSLANVRDLLPKIAKRASDDSEKWQLTDKSFRELNPYKFPYPSPADREQAINSAIKSFDRLRLSKDDKLWQLLLPREERGQGKCLSRLNVKAPEPKPAKPATPLHKMPKLNDKKPVAKKHDEKKQVKEAEPRPKKLVVKERVVVKSVKPVRENALNGNAPASSAPKAVATAAAPTNRTIADASKIRTKKAPPTDSASSPRVKPKMSSRDLHRERYQRPTKPTMPVNTKPKNPSPLSASPPVNASDFEDTHSIHKVLSNGPSPTKNPGHSDRTLKRKANDLDSDIHSLAVKKPHVDRAAPNRPPASTNRRLNGSTPSSANSLKRKSDSSSTSSTPSTKVRKVNNIDTSLASRYPHQSQTSPGASSSSTTSPSVPSLSFRQTVELSQKFQKYYKKYEDLYWKLTESDAAPTEVQRNELLKMHKNLEEMKREIKAGAGVHR